MTFVKGSKAQLKLLQAGRTKEMDTKQNLQSSVPKPEGCDGISKQ